MDAKSRNGSNVMGAKSRKDFVHNLGDGLVCRRAARGDEHLGIDPDLLQVPAPQHMASTWSAYGQRMVSTWSAHGQHMAST